MKAIKRLAKKETPVFLVIIRQIEPSSENEQKKMKEGMKYSAPYKINTQGMKESMKRRRMKLEGAERDSKSVEKKERYSIQ